MLGPGVQSRARIFILSGNNHPLFNALTVWPEGDSLRDYPMCQNSNEADLGELFVQIHAFVPGISRSNHACKKLNCSTKQLVRVLTQPQSDPDAPLPFTTVCLSQASGPKPDSRVVPGGDVARRSECPTAMVRATSDDRRSPNPGSRDRPSIRVATAALEAGRLSSAIPSPHRSLKTHNSRRRTSRAARPAATPEVHPP